MHVIDTNKAFYRVCTIICGYFNHSKNLTTVRILDCRCFFLFLHSRSRFFLLHFPIKPSHILSYFIYLCLCGIFHFPLKFCISTLLALFNTLYLFWFWLLHFFFALDNDYFFTFLGLEFWKLVHTLMKFYRLIAVQKSTKFSLIKDACAML